MLHDRELHGNDTRHLNCTAEGDLPVALGKVQVTDAEFCALDVDGEECATTTAEILDVSVTSVLWSARYRSCSFLSDLRFHLVGSASRVDILRFGGLGNDAVKSGSADQFTLSSVPFVENLLRGRTTKDARVDQAGEANVLAG